MRRVTSIRCIIIPFFTRKRRKRPRKKDSTTSTTTPTKELLRLYCRRGRWRTRGPSHSKQRRDSAIAMVGVRLFMLEEQIDEDENVDETIWQLTVAMEDMEEDNDIDTDLVRLAQWEETE